MNRRTRPDQRPAASSSRPLLAPVHDRKSATTATAPKGILATAAESLALSLLTLAEQGRATPCQGRRRDRWTSDSAEERAWSASVCVTLDCPVLQECGAAALERQERFAVWGGKDHTARANTPTAQTRGTA